MNICLNIVWCKGVSVLFNVTLLLFFFLYTLPLLYRVAYIFVLCYVILFIINIKFVRINWAEYFCSYVLCICIKSFQTNNLYLYVKDFVCSFLYIYRKSLQKIICLYWKNINITLNCVCVCVLANIFIRFSFQWKFRWKFIWNY